MDLGTWCSEAPSLGPPSPGASGPAWVCLVLVRAGPCGWVSLWGRLEMAPGGQQATSQLHIFSKKTPAITADLTGGIWKRRRGEV